MSKIEERQQKEGLQETRTPFKQHINSPKPIIPQKYDLESF